MKFKVGSTIACIPDGQYKAITKEIKPKTTFKRLAIEFIFEIAEGEHKGAELRGFCNAEHQTYTPNTKLFKWYQAATGEPLDKGDEIDTDKFKDKVLLVETEIKKSHKTGNSFSNVVNIIKVVYEL